MPLTCWIPVPPDIYWAREWAEDAALDRYNPLGEHERGHRGFTQGGDLPEDGGNRNQFRVDVADAELPRTDNIYHSTSSLSEDSDAGLIRFFSDFQVMEKNAQLLSTRDKIRTGTIGRVASPGGRRLPLYLQKFGGLRVNRRGAGLS